MGRGHLFSSSAGVSDSLAVATKRLIVLRFCAHSLFAKVDSCQPPYKT